MIKETVICYPSLQQIGEENLSFGNICFGKYYIMNMQLIFKDKLYLDKPKL